MPRAPLFATPLFKTLLFTALLAISSIAVSGQEVSVLHIKAALVDAAGSAMPVPRHALLISDDPPSTAPRRILTKIDGTADVRLRPGIYTVESDQPVVFHGKSYQWTERLEIVAGRDSVLELTAGNADVELATATTSSAAPLEADPSFLMPQWQNSVVAIWTPTAHASGFLIDARGLIATNQRAVGSATSVEVQLSPDLKVAARVLAADPKRDVAVLWIDPGVATSMRPVPLGCGQAATPSSLDEKELFTIGAPLRGPKRMTTGTPVLRPPSGSEGGPVFGAGGRLVGISSISSRVVPIGEACEVVAAAEKTMKGVVPPGGTHLPVEPSRPFPVATLKDAVQRRAGSLNPHLMSSSDFDVTLLTPLHVYGGKHDFGDWSDYMTDVPPVLLIRVTPKMVESFWMKVARGAAMTQGANLPPIKRLKSGFSRMRAFCGDAEVTPIHPFTVQQRVSDTEAVDEGLYVFDPGALGPHCASVRLELYSEKEPAKGDTRPVDPRVLERIWQDFAPYRESAP